MRRLASTSVLSSGGNNDGRRQRRRLQLINEEEEILNGAGDAAFLAENVPEHYLGKMDDFCDKCGAYFFRKEQKNCCKEGRVKPPLPAPWPAEWHRLFDQNPKLFLKNTRRLNNSLAMCSNVTKVEAEVFPFTYCISGKVKLFFLNFFFEFSSQHTHILSDRLGPNRPTGGKMFGMEWYIYDTHDGELAQDRFKFLVEDSAEVQQAAEIYASLDELIRRRGVNSYLDSFLALKQKSDEDWQPAKLVLKFGDDVGALEMIVFTLGPPPLTSPLLFQVEMKKLATENWLFGLWIPAFSALTKKKKKVEKTNRHRFAEIRGVWRAGPPRASRRDHPLPKLFFTFQRNLVKISALLS
jgi:hypothetical protein